MDNDDKQHQRQVSPQPFLVLAWALTTAGCVVVLIDLLAPRDTIQQTLVNLSMVVMATGWSLYVIVSGFRRLDRRLRDTLNRDAYARGFVDGIQRRMPEQAPPLRSVS